MRARCRPRWRSAQETALSTAAAGPAQDVALALALVREGVAGAGHRKPKGRRASEVIELQMRFEREVLIRNGYGKFVFGERVSGDG